jgi:hypothetical protein
VSRNDRPGPHPSQTDTSQTQGPPARQIRVVPRYAGKGTLTSVVAGQRPVWGVVNLVRSSAAGMIGGLISVGEGLG